MCSICKHNFATFFRSFADLFHMEESEIDTFQCLANESFAAFGYYQKRHSLTLWIEIPYVDFFSGGIKINIIVGSFR